MTQKTNSRRHIVGGMERKMRESKPKFAAGDVCGQQTVIKIWGRKPEYSSGSRVVWHYTCKCSFCGHVQVIKQAFLNKCINKGKKYNPCKECIAQKNTVNARIASEKAADKRRKDMVAAALHEREMIEAPLRIILDAVTRSTRRFIKRMGYEEVFKPR